MIMMGRPEIGKGDLIQARTGTRDAPERMFDAEVRWVHIEETTGVVVLTCALISEVPQPVLDMIRNPPPPRRARRWHRR